MRFKAVLHREGISTMLAVAHAVARVPVASDGGTCAMFLSPDKGVELRVLAMDSVQAFARLDAERFASLLVQSKAENNIYLEIYLAMLVSALKSAEKADEATLRLARRRGVPVLTLTAQTLTGIVVTQDIVVTRIMSGDEADKYREPRLRAPDVTIRFPDPKHLRTVLDRMKSLDKFVYIKAHNRGALSLRVHSDLVTTTSMFQGLELGLEASGGGVSATTATATTSLGAGSGRRKRSSRPSDVASACVALKDLSLVTAGVAAAQPRKALLAIVEAGAVVLHLALLGSSSLTFYVSTLVDDSAGDADATTTTMVQMQQPLHPVSEAEGDTPQDDDNDNDNVVRATQFR